MKRLAIGEFLRSRKSVDALRAGQYSLVTDHGKPALIVTKIGKRPRQTRADLEREARQICPTPRPQLNFTATLAGLKTR